MAIDSIHALIRLHEGVMLRVYDDATGRPIGPGDRLVGHPTIGIGRALDVRGITQDEADELFRHDVAETTTALSTALSWFLELDLVRRAVLVDMAFNLGLAGLLKFSRTLAAVDRGDYEAAAVEMLDSRWAGQVGDRAMQLADMMRAGAWPSSVAAPPG